MSCLPPIETGEFMVSGTPAEFPRISLYFWVAQPRACAKNLWMQASPLLGRDVKVEKHGYARSFSVVTKHSGLETLKRKEVIVI